MRGLEFFVIFVVDLLINTAGSFLNWKMTTEPDYGGAEIKAELRRHGGGGGCRLLRDEGMQQDTETKQTTGNPNANHGASYRFLELWGEINTHLMQSNHACPAKVKGAIKGKGIWH